MRGFHNEVRRELAAARYEATVRVTPDFQGFRDIPHMPDQNVRVRAQTDERSFADTTNAIALLGRNLMGLAMPVGLAAGIPTILGLGAAATQAAGALLVLPAAGAAAGIALVTTKVATVGLGDAFKEMFKPDRDPAKLAEAMGRLSPTAREFAMAVDTVRPALGGLQLDVQNAAFRYLSVSVEQLARAYLPVLRTGLVGVATELNVGARQIAAFAQQGQTVRDVATLFDATRLTVRNLSPALVDVLQILRDVSAVGAQFLPGLASGFAGATHRAAEFVAAARESGQLAEWMRRGMLAVQLFGIAFGNVGGIMANVWRASGIEADSFLISLVGITQQFENWTASAQGAEVIHGLFVGLNALGVALLPVMRLIVGAIVQMVTTLGPAMPALVQGFADVLAAASPMTTMFFQLATAILPPLGAALSFLAPVLGPIVAGFAAAAIVSKAWAIAQGIGTAALVAYNFAIRVAEVAQLAYMVLTSTGTIRLIAWSAAQWLVNAALAANPIGLVVIAIAAFVAALVLAWNHSETFRAIVTAAWASIKVTAETTWQSLQTIFAALGQAVIATGAFFTSLWQDYVVPAWNGIVEVGRVAAGIILAIILVPIQIALNVLGAVFTEFGRIAVLAWTVLKEELLLWWAVIQPVWQTVIGFLSGVFTAAWGAFRDFAVGCWVFIRDNVLAAWNFIRDNIWQPIISFLGGVFTASWTAFRDTAVSLWTSLRDVLLEIWNFIRDNIWNPIVSYLATTFAESWRGWVFLATTLWTGLRDFLNLCWAFIRDNIWNPIVAYLGGPFAAAWTAFTNLASALWNTMRDVINAGWIFIRDNIWNPMINFITVTVPDGFRRGVEMVGALWNAIKAALRTPLQAAIDIVWNNGIVSVWELVRGLIPGLPGPLGRFTLPGLAAGGPVEQPTVALIGEQGPEYVLSNPAVRAMGGIGVVDALHQSMMSPRRTLKALNSGAIVEGADHTGLGTSRAGLGGVAPHVGQAANYLGPKFGIGSIGGVGARANASDHPRGLALDFMTSGNNGTALADFLSSAANWAHFAVKYIIWRQRILNSPGGAWSGMADRGSPTANHMDHVHVSFKGAPGSGAMDGGAGGPSILDLLTGIWSKVTSAVGQLAQFGNSPWGQAVRGFGTKIVDEVWKFVSGKAAAMVTAALGVVSGATSIGGGGPVKDVVQRVASQFGMGSGAEWVALQQLIQKESGWNPTAQNPTSTAYGLFQFLNGTWAAMGASKTSDPAQQTLAGIGYIRSRYGSAQAALAFHNAHNYYDRGGVARGRGIMLKNVISPERTLSPRQTEAFDELVSQIAGRARTRVLRADGVDTANGLGTVEGGAFIGTLVVPTPEGASVTEVVDSVMTRARHERKNRRYGRAG